MNRNIETVQSIYKAFGQGNVAAILALLSPQVEWQAFADHSGAQAGHPQFTRRHGREGAAQFFRALGEQQFHEFKVLDVIGSGNQVASEVFVDVTYPATGRRVKDEAVHLWSFDDDGLVTRYRTYVDTAKYLAPAGVPA